MELGIAIPEIEGKFITAEPEHDIFRPHSFLQAVSYHNQHLVADAVAEVVIDALEVIAVQNAKSSRLIQLELVNNLVLAAGTVEDASQTVCFGNLAEVVLQHLFLLDNLVYIENMSLRGGRVVLVP